MSCTRRASLPPGKDMQNPSSDPNVDVGGIVDCVEGARLWFDGRLILWPFEPVIELEFEEP
jgi:hypothetical protein